MTRWFIDTGFVIALASPRDTHHAAATQLADHVAQNSIRLLSTDAVLLEVGAALSRLAYRPAAVNILRALREDDNVELVPIDARLLASATDFFARMIDKEWSLTDCVSFEVMRVHGVVEALSADAHFEQAGFRALLRRQ
jgi:uncharacterized protein